MIDFLWPWGLLAAFVVAAGSVFISMFLTFGINARMERVELVLYRMASSDDLKTIRDDVKKMVSDKSISRSIEAIKETVGYLRAIEAHLEVVRRDIELKDTREKDKAEWEAEMQRKWRAELEAIRKKGESGRPLVEFGGKETDDQKENSEDDDRPET